MEEYWVCSECGAVNLYPQIEKCEVCGNPISQVDIDEIQKKKKEIAEQEKRYKLYEKRAAKERKNGEKNKSSDKKWRTGRCDFCNHTGFIQDVTIVDKMGTRYRSLCENCISKNAGNIKYGQERKKFFSFASKSKKTQSKPIRKDGVCAFCERKGFVQEVTIVDDMGTRYRDLCDSCRAKYEK